jgi:Xaa-Pro aminopeptidase
MNSEALSRVNNALRSRGLDAALFTSPWTITWLTGYAPPIQTGPSPFDGGPALAWYRGGDLTLVASDGEAAAARSTGCEVREYAGYTIDQPLDVVERQTAIVREFLGSLGRDGRGRGAKVAVEMRFLTAPLLGALQESLPGATMEPIDGALEPLRAVKTADEISKMRAALALCDLAQTEVRARLRPGISEIALWGRVKTSLEVEAGGRLPLLTDLVAGTRNGDIGGPPGVYVLREGDPVMADIVPRLDGYWGDICGGHFVGDPSEEMARIWGTVRDTLRRGIDAVRPGVVSRDLDTLMRESIRDSGYEPYPHHSGHGLGTSFHEEPRIVPYNEMVLQPGMIVALEPGIYLPGIGGVRLEDVVLVNQGGCEVLTRHLAESRGGGGAA